MALKMEDVKVVKSFREEVAPQKMAFNGNLKRAGPFLLGPQLSVAPAKCVSHCLARRDRTDEFRTVKILTLPGPTEAETTDTIQGKILLHTEYGILKEVDGMKGVVKQYGMYKDQADEEIDIGGQGYLTGKTKTRICLVLDCCTPHDFHPKFASLSNLQQFVIKEKRLPEQLAVKIFYNVVKVVENLHKRNIIHRDLKLGNILLDRDTRDITLTNFGLGKKLISENELLRDQRGSPAYISPDVISGTPYLGKPSDMWALGVVLYTMLYGQFPFYDASPTELFRKIKLAEYQIPMEYAVSQPTIKLVQSLLVLDPQKRLTAAATREILEGIIVTGETFLVDSDLQVVPDFSLGQDFEDHYQPKSRVYKRHKTFPEVNGADIEAMLAELSSSAAVVSAEPTTRQTSKEESNGDEAVHEPPSKVARNALPAMSLGGLSNFRVTSVDEPTRIIPQGDPAAFRDRVRSLLNGPSPLGSGTNPPSQGQGSRAAIVYVAQPPQRQPAQASNTVITPRPTPSPLAMPTRDSTSNVFNCNQYSTATETARPFLTARRRAKRWSMIFQKRPGTSSNVHCSNGVKSTMGNSTRKRRANIGTVRQEVAAHN